MAEAQAETILNSEGEVSAVIVELPEGATNEGGEGGDETAVEIARIEAERDVTIAETHAAVEIAHIEARAEHEGTDEKWHELQSQLASLQEQVQTITTALAVLSTPQPLLVEEAPEPLAEAPETETNLTPPSTKDETSETPTEAIDVSEAEKPEAPEPPRRSLRFL